MSKFYCECGFVINLSEGWSKYEYSVVLDRDLEMLSDDIDKKEIVDSGSFFDAFDRISKALYICPECKNIYIENGENSFDLYCHKK